MLLLNIEHLLSQNFNKVKSLYTWLKNILRCKNIIKKISIYMDNKYEYLKNKHPTTKIFL